MFELSPSPHPLVLDLTVTLPHRLQN